MSWTQEEIQATVQQVLIKASSDDQFKAMCLNDIRSAVREATGKEIPAEFKLNVVDGASYHATIVLPAVKSSEDELSETELEAVAGGSKSSITEGFNDIGSAITGAANWVGSVITETADDFGGAFERTGNKIADKF